MSSEEVPQRSSMLQRRRLWNKYASFNQQEPIGKSHNKDINRLGHRTHLDKRDGILSGVTRNGTRQRSSMAAAAAVGTTASTTAAHKLNFDKDRVSRRSSVASISSSLHNMNIGFSEENTKNVLIAIEGARIYTYNANIPSQLRRSASMDAGSMHSLKRVDSLESIRSNITDILSNDGEEYNDHEGDDAQSITSRRKALNAKGRLLAHGILQIYELEGGIRYLSCGGGRKTTRETFVHPLLPRLKIFKISDNMFILMVSHPERFWRIIFERFDNGQLEEVEQIFKSACCFIDMFPSSALQSNSNSNSNSSSALQSNSNRLHNLKEPLPIALQMDEMKKGKTHLGNRLSKFFKAKNKQKPSGMRHLENEAGDAESTPSTYSPTAGGNLLDNSSKSNLAESSTVATEYNSYIDKLIEEKIEEKVRNQLKTEIGGASGGVSEGGASGGARSSRAHSKSQVKKESSNKEMMMMIKSDNDSISSNESAMYRIIEENCVDEFENPQLLSDLTEKLNNDVNDEILRQKRQSVSNGLKDYVVAKFQDKYGGSWADKKRIVEAEEAEDEYEDEEDILQMIRPSVEVKKGRSRPFSRHAIVNYQPHLANDEVNSYYSNCTFRRNVPHKTSKASLQAQSQLGFNDTRSYFSMRNAKRRNHDTLASKDIYSIIMDENEPLDSVPNPPKLQPTRVYSRSQLNSKTELQNTGFISKMFGW